MGVTKYNYNGGQSWFSFLLCTGMVLFCIYKIIGGFYIPPLSIFMLFAFALDVYVCKTFFIPYLKNKTALELDDKKLQFFSSGKTIYWKDIDEVEQGMSSQYGGTAIRFTMADGSRKKINTKYIAGDSQAVYDNIRTYFINCGSKKIR